jgi:anti-sigma regulatory factor (Ser/Thr protein kinase)
MAVPAARGFAATTLRDWALSDQLVEIAELVVSELVGNAVEHGGGTAELVLTLRDDVVRVDVIDHNRDLPVVLSPEPSEDRHRGLLIVSALSTKWGTDHAGAGKTVWAELPLSELSTEVPPAPKPAADGRSLSG